jgi:hypothetical protein
MLRQMPDASEAEVPREEDAATAAAAEAEDDGARARARVPG